MKSRKCFLIILILSPFLLVAAEFQSEWPKEVNRIWIGPEYWANRLQDWRIKDGRLECTEARFNKPVRTVHLLSHRLNDQSGSFEISVKTGTLDKSDASGTLGWSGFLIGAGEPDMDYRGASLVHHEPGKGGGILAVMEGSGKAVFRDMEAENYRILNSDTNSPSSSPEQVLLVLKGKSTGDTYTLELLVSDLSTNNILSTVSLDNVEKKRLFGNIALVSHPGFPSEGNQEEKNGSRFWFKDWNVSGSKIDEYPKRVFGPVLATQYTVHQQKLKMTAQFPPLGEADLPKASLEIKTTPDEPWQTVDEKRIVHFGYTAGFVVKNWDDSREHDFRVVYPLKTPTGKIENCYYYGTIRKNPIDKAEFRVAAFTGNMNMHHTAESSKGERWADTKVILTPDAVQARWTYDNVWFPHAELVRHVKQHSPDLLFFSGDQIYEHVPTRGEQTELDYLYKWYLWCWAYRDLTRNIPTVTIPDDHDVYQGNLWGAGGKHCENIHEGGYQMSAELVNVVQRTHNSHLPDPFDPTPVQRGIGVYYTELNWGGISFAIIEDRKFKTGPAILPEDIPRSGPWISQEFVDMSRLDVPGAVLLGDRQLKFLKSWTENWDQGLQVKALLSQTNFNGVHTRPDQKLARDLDKNSWPQSGRNRAVDIIRRGFAVHICGDQHLGTTIHYGVDEWEDGSVAFCVPSIAVGHQRVWEPVHPGENHLPGNPDYTGRYFDAFNNRMTVYAAANPIRPAQLSEAQRNRKRAELYRKRSGYGIIDFNKMERTITMNCWPREVDPTQKEAKQFDGWPLIVNQLDNYGGENAAYLPTLELTGYSYPVVQVLNEKTREIENTIRLNKLKYQPKVLRPGQYMIRISENGQYNEISDIQAIEGHNGSILKIQKKGN